MKYEIVPSNQFRKDLKLAQKRGYDLDKIKKVITALAGGETLEAKYRDHALTGDYSGFRECHRVTRIIRTSFLATNIRHQFVKRLECINILSSAFACC